MTAILTFRVLAVFVSTVSAAAAQTPSVPDFSGTYLCKTEAMGGIAPTQDGGWIGKSFNHGDQSYLIKLTDTGERMDIEYAVVKARLYTVGIKEFGTDDKLRNCFGQRPVTKGEVVATIDGDMQCTYFDSTYIFDFSTMRFQIMFKGGYMDADGDNEDTPYVSVGKCERVTD